MTLAIAYSRAGRGIKAPAVTVETHISKGLPSLSIVGLPETAVKESRDRVRSALLNTDLEFPPQRITINLAPADLRKEGGRFDLPIALGILAASGQIPAGRLADFEFGGELALSGGLRPFKGVLPFSVATRQADRALVIPLANADEAALPHDSQIYPAQHLLEVCAHLLGTQSIEPHRLEMTPGSRATQRDLADVRGQHRAKRALEIAAAGRHSLLMTGPPGTGKTMLASRLPGILPEMSDEEALELATIRSISGKDLDLTNWRRRPFRAPHHTASCVALVGGGSPPRPGEISLAHHGVLFLDELPEFHRHALDALREPLESGEITISRAAHQTDFPARFQLIAAMNPCPCGHLGDPDSLCKCTSEQVARYQTRISGPLMDRIDLHIEVPKLPKGILSRSTEEARQETSITVQCRVQRAHQRQLDRAGVPNANLYGQCLEKHCKLNGSDQQLLEDALQRLGLSARAYHRILRVARTIADLDDSNPIETPHLTEALTYGRYKNIERSY